MTWRGLSGSTHGRHVASGLSRGHQGHPPSTPRCRRPRCFGPAGAEVLALSCSHCSAVETVSTRVRGAGGKSRRSTVVARVELTLRVPRRLDGHEPSRWTARRCASVRGGGRISAVPLRPMTEACETAAGEARATQPITVPARLSWGAPSLSDTSDCWARVNLRWAG